MTCERYRERASARLDGEPLGMSASALENHLGSCTDCAAWLDAAVRAGRGLRVTGATPPDLSEQILRDVVLPAARIARRRWVIRAGLAILGFVQWALAVPALFGDNMGMSASMAMGVHAAHESAAWNLAMGASFLAVAVKPARAVGALPILTTFVGVLAVLSIPDLISGVVGPSRLASHAGVLAGLILVVLMWRSERLPTPERAMAKPADGPSVKARRRGAA